MTDHLTPFDTRAEFQHQLGLCFDRAQRTLHMFDPDFALWELGSSAVDASLRRFLANRGRIELVAHSNGHLEQHCPRFLRLLQEYGHAITCRQTSKALRQLTDSFCIADGQHIVRRFHCDHLRGEAAVDHPAALQASAERFAGIWEESAAGLHAGTTGL